MWRPEYINIINLMSHSDTRFEFIKGRVVMIKGRNEYDRKSNSNGSGKSVLFEGISIAFTGDPVKKVDTPNMIKDGCSSATVEFSMNNSVTNETVDILRTIYRAKNKYGLLSIKLNGDAVEFAKVDDGNKWILSKIGITREDLFNYYIISKKRYKSFFYSSDGDKRKLISRFSNADIVDGVYDEISNDVKEIESEIQLLEADKNIILGRISAYQEQIDNRETKSKDELITSLNKAIMLKEEYVINVRNDIKEFRSKIDICRNSRKIKDAEILSESVLLGKLKSTDYSKKKAALNDSMELFNDTESEYKSEVKEAKKLVAGFEEKIEAINEELSSINKNLLDFIDCPKCEHRFSFKDAKLDIKSLNGNKVRLEKEIKSINSKILQVNEIISEINESIADVGTKITEAGNELRGIEVKETAEVSAINAKKRLISKLESERDTIDANISKYTSSIKSCDDNILIAINSVSSMHKEKDEINSMAELVDPNKDLELKIKESESDIVITDSKLLGRSRVKADKFKWIELYKRFNVKLSNMAIKSIEGLANDIQEKMGSNLSLSIDGYKINRDGSVSDQITANVLRYGIIEGTFFRFSEGEQGKLNISATIAMQQLINMSCKSGGLDLMFIDEITESLDSTGIASIVESLDKLGRTIVIITHVSDELIVIPNEVIVVKTSEGSKILN